MKQKLKKLALAVILGIVLPAWLGFGEGTPLAITIVCGCAIVLTVIGVGLEIILTIKDSHKQPR